MSDLPSSPAGVAIALADRLPAFRERYGDAAVDTQLQALAAHGDAVDDPALWLDTALAQGFKYMPIERLRRCACGSTSLELLSRFVFWNLQGITRCNACGLTFVSPRLTSAAISRVFSEFYFDLAQPEYWGQRRQSVFADVYRLLRRNPCRRVLDVGAAYGHFVRWLRDRGVDAEGSDISPASVAWGRRNLGVKLHEGRIDTLDLPAGSMDCIVSLDALYYSPDPVRELNAMHRLLRPGGHLVLRLRNGRRTAADAGRQGRRPVGTSVMPDAHLWAFTPGSISTLLRASGFEVELIEPAAYSQVGIASVPLRAWLTLSRAWTVLAGPSAVHTQSFNVLAHDSS